MWWKATIVLSPLKYSTIKKKWSNRTCWLYSQLLRIKFHYNVHWLFSFTLCTVEKQTKHAGWIYFVSTLSLVFFPHKLHPKFLFQEKRMNTVIKLYKKKKKKKRIRFMVDVFTRLCRKMYFQNIISAIKMEKIEMLSWFKSYFS